MATIEERAKRANWGLHIDSFDVLNEETKNAILRFATEQDSIARVEERERCIKIAREHLCKLCCAWTGTECDGKYCKDEDNLRKAMEGGEDGDSDG